MYAILSTNKNSEGAWVVPRTDSPRVITHAQTLAQHKWRRGNAARVLSSIGGFQHGFGPRRTATVPSATRGPCWPFRRQRTTRGPTEANVYWAFGPTRHKVSILEPGMWNHPLQVSVFLFFESRRKRFFSGLLVATYWTERVEATKQEGTHALHARTTIHASHAFVRAHTCNVRRKHESAVGVAEDHDVPCRRLWLSDAPSCGVRCVVLAEKWQMFGESREFVLDRV
jgi:hypothetical protein